MEQNDRSAFLKLLKDNAPKPKDKIIPKVPRRPRPEPFQISSKNKTVVFSGTLKSMKRTLAERYLNALGGTMARAVSKDVDYIVTGSDETYTTKTDRAKELKIPFITEEEWLKILKDNGAALGAFI